MRTLLKNLLCFIIYYSGLEYFTRTCFPTKKVAIIMFHAVGNQDTFNNLPKGYNPYLDPKEFENKIKFFKRYHILSFSQFLNCYKKGKIPRNSVVLTFDDGYSHKAAFEIIKKYTVPVTIFISTRYIGSEELLPLHAMYYSVLTTSKNSVCLMIPPGNQCVNLSLNSKKQKKNAVLALNKIIKDMSEQYKADFIKQLHEKLGVANVTQSNSGFKMLTWEEVVEMGESGLVEFGSHTMSHCILSKTSAEQAYKELYNSKREIEKKLGKKVVFFAFPNGQKSDYNQSHIALLKDAGYEMACTTQYGFNDAETPAFELMRIGANYPNHILACKFLFHSKFIFRPNINEKFSEL